MRNRAVALIPLMVLLVSAASASPLPAPDTHDASTPASVAPQGDPNLRLIFEAASFDKDRSEAALEQLEPAWQIGYAPMLLDLMKFMRTSAQRPRTGIAGAGEGFTAPDSDIGREAFPANDPLRARVNPVRRRPRDPSADTRKRLREFLERQTGQKHGDDMDKWRAWLWSADFTPHPAYGEFKANLYGQIDPTMSNFFPVGDMATIRLDEVEWGGVSVNGIPPLDHPTVTPAAEATYLEDDNVVFGFYLNGEARAYPKRIIAWHELLLDNIGGVETTVVYCTLCGTVIPYRSQVGSRHVKFGTSGFLYRSNKLLFDDITFTLWSSLTGEPVVGRMVGSGLKLEPMPVVTTTWGEWRTLHPDTTVLSLDTGFERDYTEGAAYRDYFESDELMFPVPEEDERLELKDEVLAIRLAASDDPAAEPEALAIAADYLRRNRIVHADLAGHTLAVVTTPGGANRVFDVGSVRLVRDVGNNRLEDEDGTIWLMTEEGLFAVGDPSRVIDRIPAWRAFWFGWRAQYPSTELIRG